MKDVYSQDDVRESPNQVWGQMANASFIYDEFGNLKTEFQAICLSRPILTTGRETGNNLATAKYMYKGRIIHNPSPHDPLPDPCDASLGFNQAETLAVIAAHTTFYSETDLAHQFSAPKVGDIVNVRLEPGKYMNYYNLEDGTHINVENVNYSTVMDPVDGVISGDTLKICENLVELFGSGELTLRQINSVYRRANGRTGTAAEVPEGVVSDRDFNQQRTLAIISDSARFSSDARIRFEENNIPIVANYTQDIVRGGGVTCLRAKRRAIDMIAYTQPSWILIAIGQTDAIDLIRWLTGAGQLTQFTDPERIFNNALRSDDPGYQNLRDEPGRVIGGYWQERFRNGSYTTQFLVDIFNASPDSKVVWAITPFIYPREPEGDLEYYRFLSTQIGQMSYFQIARSGGGITNTPPSALTSLPSFIPATAESEGSMQIVNNLYSIGTLTLLPETEDLIPDIEAELAELIRSDSPFSATESCTEDELARAIYELSAPDAPDDTVLAWNASPGYGYSDDYKTLYQADLDLQGYTIITEMIERIDREDPLQQVFE